MNNLTETYSLNFNNLQFLHGDFLKSEDWSEKIYENGGYSNDCQYMTFSCGENEVIVDFEFNLSGYHSFDPGDWYTAPYSETEVTDVDVQVTKLHVGEWEVELNNDLKKLFEVEIKKYL